MARFPCDAGPGRELVGPNCYFMPHHNVITHTSQGEK